MCKGKMQFFLAQLAKTYVRNVYTYCLVICKPFKFVNLKTVFPVLAY